jgi:hypothetical protein
MGLGSHLGRLEGGVGAALAQGGGGGERCSNGQCFIVGSFLVFKVSVDGEEERQWAAVKSKSIGSSRRLCRRGLGMVDAAPPLNNRQAKLTKILTKSTISF